MSVSSVDDWFVAEVLPLEGMLVGFLRNNWRDESEILDLRQDIYVRVYESAKKSRPTSAKSFVFAVARNLMIDRTRRAKVVSMELMEDIEQLSVYDSVDPSVEKILSSRQELRKLQDILNSLPSRCREIVQLRRVKGLSQKSVAAKLGISESAVEKQVSKGIRKLAEAMYGINGPYVNDVTERAKMVKVKK